MRIALTTLALLLGLAGHVLAADYKPIILDAA